MDEDVKIIKNVSSIELSGRNQILKDRDMQIINEHIVDPAFERSMGIEIPKDSKIVVDRLERSSFRLEVPGAEGNCELNHRGDLMGCKFSKII